MEISWKRILVKFLVGSLLLGVGLVAYDYWRTRDGWCVKYYPDGSQEVLYGADCRNEGKNK